MRRLSRRRLFRIVLVSRRAGRHLPIFRNGFGPASGLLLVLFWHLLLARLGRAADLEVVLIVVSLVLGHVLFLSRGYSLKRRRAPTPPTPSSSDASSMNVTVAPVARALVTSSSPSSISSTGT